MPLYTSDPERSGALETKAAGLTAHSLVREGNVGIEEYYPEAPGGGATSYAVRWRGERLTSIEPLASALTFAAFLLPYRDLPPETQRIWPLFPRVAAQVAALAVFGLGLCLLGVASPGRALAAAAIVALATSHRTITGAALWQHTSGALWLALGLLLWTRASRRPGLYPAAGAALALATACRPILVPAALLLVVDAWLGARGLRTKLLTALAVAGIGAGALAANLALHGSLLGGRVDVLAAPEIHSRTTSYFGFSPVHLLGLLLAPSRGLFIYSPVLLFALPGLVRCLRDPQPPALRWITLAGLTTFMLYGWLSTWWAGVVFGPRYTSDLLMFFGLWLTQTPLPRRMRPLWAGVFGLALLGSLAVQEVGARAYPCGWNQRPLHVDRAPERVWDWRDSQIERCIHRLLRRSTGAAAPTQGARISPAVRTRSAKPRPAP